MVRIVTTEENNSVMQASNKPLLGGMAESSRSYPQIMYIPPDQFIVGEHQLIMGQQTVPSHQSLSLANINFQVISKTILILS